MSLNTPNNKLLPEAMVEKMIKHSSTHVDRGRWFIISVVMLLIIIILVFKVFHFSSIAANNMKIIDTRLNIDGTWDVSFRDGNKDAAIPKSIVKSLIRRYTKYRLSKNSSTIETFYGYASQLMDNDLYNKFSSVKGNNATKVIEELISCLNCDSIDIEPLNSINYDSYDKNYGKQGIKQVYQTNAYFDEIKINGNGTIIKVTKKIFNLTWRIRSKKEQEDYIRMLSKNEKSDKKLMAILDVNPIGLLIVDEEVINISK